MTSAIALMTGSMAQRRRGFGLGAVLHIGGLARLKSDLTHVRLVAKTEVCHRPTNSRLPNRMIRHLATIEVR